MISYEVDFICRVFFVLDLGEGRWSRGFIWVSGGFKF